jgi:hypothetical protein
MSQRVKRWSRLTLVLQVVHPPIDPEGKTDDELMEATRLAIASALPKDKVA